MQMGAETVQLSHYQPGKLTVLLEQEWRYYSNTFFRTVRTTETRGTMVATSSRVQRLRYKNSKNYR